MFGFVAANTAELTKEQKLRYNAVYCGICRCIRSQSSNLARLGLRYDMAFLALLLMSLYEPEETGGKNACLLHPVRHKPWIENECVRYGADMNVALAYFKALDDRSDEGSAAAGVMVAVFGKEMDAIRNRWPRQCDAMERCIARLRTLEQENCGNPDEPAACFGELMAELLVWQEDLWAPLLRQMGMALGRYIYLADAAVDYRRDKARGRYNPFLAMGTGEDWPRWEQYLVLEMSRCTEQFEKLPLVQDKQILDNILYSGIWVEYRRKQARQEKRGGGNQ